MISPALIFALLFQATPLPSMPPPPLPPPTPVTATAPASPSATAAPASGATPATLAASVTAINLQPGQSQTLSISNSSGALSAAIDNAAIASAAVDQNAQTVTITAAQQTGRATLTVSDEAGQTIAVPIHVGFPAATLPSQIVLRVTGTRVDPAWLQTQVQRAISRAVALQPGVPASAVQLAPYQLPPSLSPGATADVPLTVHVPGGDRYLDTDATATIALENVSAPAFAPPYLFYDDDPEKITANGVLYRGTIRAGTPARLYYYHQNEVEPRRVLVVLTGTAPSTVQLIDASAGPNIDVMSVGHAVSRDFLVRKPINEGIVVDVQPGSPYALEDFGAVQPVDGVAGNIGFQILSGGDVTVTVLAVAPGAGADDIAATLNAPQLPGDGHHRTGVFDIRSFGQTALAAAAGGDDPSVQYGAATPPNAPGSQPGHDYGEYGVLRSITIDLNNPQPHDQTMYLYERPLGGVVRSSFLIDGQLVEVGCARVSNRYQVGQPISLPANSSSRVLVQTMTDGGSNYPVEFGVTPAAPIPTTPPMSAPDGCFPKAQPLPSPTPQPSPSARR